MSTGKKSAADFCKVFNKVELPLSAGWLSIWRALSFCQLLWSLAMSEAASTSGKLQAASPKSDPVPDSSVGPSRLKRKGTGPRDFNHRASRQRAEKQQLQNKMKSERGFAEEEEEEEEG